VLRGKNLLTLRTQPVIVRTPTKPTITSNKQEVNTTGD
jgi:hypothetical protein